MKIKTYLLLTLLALPSSTFASEPTMTIYKTPSCGCCQKWVDHVNENGFSTKTVSLNDLSTIKSKFGVTGRYQSCHTGVVNTGQTEYVFEGHIPAKYVDQFLANPPDGAIGLSVPGMPAGSPGMEVGDRRDYYRVILLKENGEHEVYAHVNQPEQ